MRGELTAKGTFGRCERHLFSMEGVAVLREGRTAADADTARCRAGSQSILARLQVSRRRADSSDVSTASQDLVVQRWLGVLALVAWQGVELHDARTELRPHAPDVRDVGCVP